MNGILLESPALADFHVVHKSVRRRENNHHLFSTGSGEY